MKLQYFVENFEWDSEDQRKGFLSVVQYLHRNEQFARGEYIKDFWMLSPPEILLVLFFLQKEHEAQRWMVETVGFQLTQLEDQIMELKREVRRLGGLDRREPGGTPV